VYGHAAEFNLDLNVHVMDVAVYVYERDNNIINVVTCAFYVMHFSITLKVHM